MKSIKFISATSINPPPKWANVLLLANVILAKLVEANADLSFSVKCNVKEVFQ